MVNTHFRLLHVLLVVFALSLILPASALASNIQTKTDVSALRALGKNAQATAVELSADLRHRNLAGQRSVYSTVTRNVPVAAIRQQAVKAVSRGRIHPAFLVASVAAGLLIDGDTGEIVEEVPADDLISNTPTMTDSEYQDLLSGEGTEGEREFGGGGGTGFGETSCADYTHMPDPDADHSVLYMDGSRCRWSYFSCSSGTGVFIEDGDSYGQRCVITPQELPAPPPATKKVPLNDAEMAERLDPHIPPVLAEEIADDPESDWANDTDSDPQLNSKKGLPPELRDAATKDRENAEADAKGEERPHQDQDTDTKNPEDQLMDEISEPPPGGFNFPSEPEPEWNIEMLGPDDLEPEDVDVGATASCPAPYVIEFGGFIDSSVEIPFDHICEFAEFVRGFFVAGAWLIAAVIVMRK